MQQAWVGGVASQTHRKLAGKGDLFTLAQQARMLWAAAATLPPPAVGTAAGPAAGAVPGQYKELVNIFAGGQTSVGGC